jgi:hypothetical protein
MEVDLASWSISAEDHLLTDPAPAPPPPHSRTAAHPSLEQRSHHTLRNLRAKLCSASSTENPDAKTNQQGVLTCLWVAKDGWGVHHVSRQ